MTSREGVEPLLSLVVAAQNEEHCLDALFARLDAVLSKERCRVEYILLDDGSTDGTANVMQRLAKSDPSKTVVRFERNLGHQRALVEGMRRSRGDIVLTIDADLQHPPEYVPAMIQAWRDGFDVVHMRRQNPDQTTPFQAALRSGFYVLFNALSDVDVSEESTDYRLVDRAALPSLLRAWDARRFLRAAARAADGRHTVIGFDADRRFAGESKYTTGKLTRLALRIVYGAAASRRNRDRSKST